MTSITVTHQSIIQDWPTPAHIQNPQTLVLGSFNPFFEDGQVVDYFYGRPSNYFWKVIAQLAGHQNEDHFLKNINHKLDFMNNRFCCIDVIDSIVFTSENEPILQEYINKKIKSGFLDQHIFKSKTQFVSKTNSGTVYLKRNYNHAIIESLLKSSSIKRVVHTMGSNRITDQTANPKEKRLAIDGFEGYINRIKTICANRKIRFINQSYSPSEYAVKNGSTPIPEFANFLIEHLYLPRVN